MTLGSIKTSSAARLPLSVIEAKESFSTERWICGERKSLKTVLLMKIIFLLWKSILSWIFLKICFYDFSVKWNDRDQHTLVSSIRMVPLLSQVCKVGTSVNLSPLGTWSWNTGTQDICTRCHWSWSLDTQISTLIHYYISVLLFLHQTLSEALLKLYLLFLIHIRVLRQVTIDLISKLWRCFLRNNRLLDNKPHPNSATYCK